MNRSTLRILKKVSRRGDITLAEAIRIGHKQGSDHRSQYPLALLLEEHYLGMTITSAPPQSFDGMREFALAITLHMFLLTADSTGIVTYRGVESSGSIDPSEEKVFLNAKGALYLDAYREKRQDRIWSIALGFTTGFLVAISAAWAKRHYGL